MTRQKIANFLTYLCLFLLPWQTVWIYDSLTLASSTGLGAFGGEGWEYGKMTHYAVQFLIVVAALARWEIKKSKAEKKIIKNGWWFFGAMIFVALLSVNPYLSGAWLFHLLSALILFWLLLDERISTKKIIWFFVLGLIVPCLLGWWQVLTGGSPASTLFGLAEHLAETSGAAVVETAGERIMRAYGAFAHPNIFGGYLAMAIFALMTSAMNKKFRLPLLFLLSSTLIVTFSRSAWLALIFSVVVYLFLTWRRKLQLSKKFLTSLGTVFLVAVVTASFFHGAVFARVEATERLEEKSLVERQNEYQMIGEVIKINPFVGVGPGAYTVALEKLYPGQPVWSYQPMHNSFLLFFAEVGLLGFIFLLNFLRSIFRATQQSINALEVPEAAQKVQRLSALAPLIIALTTLAFLDHYLWSQWAGLALVAVFLGIFVRRLDEN